MTEPYNTERRSEAASKGWQTRRENLKQKDRGGINTSGSVSQSDTDQYVVGGPLPVQRDSLFGNMAVWEDEIYDLDPDGYMLMHSCAPVRESVRKLAIRVANLNWSIVGEGERADQMRDIVFQSEGWTDMIEWLIWAMVDGVRFMQIRSKPSRDGLWTVPTFWMGGRKKAKAGGEMQWDGGDNLVLRQHTTGVETQESKDIPIWQFIIHRPGAGSNPEGDLDIGLAVYKIASMWSEALKNTDAHMKLFGLPWLVYKGNFQGVTPSNKTSILSQRIQALKDRQHNEMVGMDAEEILELIEPKGQGFKDLMEFAKYLEGLIDQIFLSNTLTSNTADSGPAGSSTVHMEEEDKAAFFVATQLAESLNRSLLPWVDRKNEGLAELKEGEMSPFLWPMPAEEDGTADDQDIEVVDPDNQIPTQTSEEEIDDIDDSI